jgi:hypothetical protein
MFKIALGLIRKHLAAAVFLLSACVLAPLGGSAQSSADPTQVDLLLVLAVDASGSVSEDRFELQRAGYAAAFRAPEVISAIRSGYVGSIAVTMLQWTGPSLHVVVVPWTLVKDRESAEAIARAIDSGPRQLFGGGTSISGAIDFSVTQFPLSRWKSNRRVIDVSGDGANSSGRPVRYARDGAVAQDIVINGLPILAIEPYLDEHYRQEVIGGPGSFVIAAQDFEAFADAVRRKLVLEISGLPEPTKRAEAAPTAFDVAMRALLDRR